LFTGKNKWPNDLATLFYHPTKVPNDLTI